MSIWSKLFLQENLAEDLKDVTDVHALVGQTGEAITALRPYGQVDFSGVRLEARSQSSYIAAGQWVQGIYVKDNVLFVKPKE